MMGLSNFQSKTCIVSNPEKQAEAREGKKASEESPKCKQFA